jgi:hypothetical protein
MTILVAGTQRADGAGKLGSPWKMGAGAFPVLFRNQNLVVTGTPQRASPFL